MMLASYNGGPEISKLVTWPRFMSYFY